MKPIETELWKPSPHDPGKLGYAGQRSALEVFQELHYRLDNMGYLPDEYFLLAHDLRDGAEFPRDAYLYCTTDYGGNEGIYVDVHLRVPQEGGGTTTRNFATGKTLGESGPDLDRMHLIASAITKAFHEDGVHSRYIMLGKRREPEGVVMHLTPQEHRLIVDALVLQRNQALEEASQVEQLLQRTTGGVLQFINETGAKPLKLSNMDYAELAIRNGNLAAFCAVLPEVSENPARLLALTSGRPGNVGMEMTAELLQCMPKISAEDYLKACQGAVEIGDTARVQYLLERSEKQVHDFDISLYGDVISHAFMSGSEHRRGIKMACDLVEGCTTEQIAAANPRLLVWAANSEHHRLMRSLVEKGIDTNTCAAELFHTLDRHQNGWQIISLLHGGMKTDPQNYAALGACIDVGNAEAAEMLLQKGMDFDGYTAWATREHRSTQKPEVEASLRELWENVIKPSAMEPQASESEIQMNL